MSFHLNVDFPLRLEMEGNPYKWIPFRDSDGIYKLPCHSDGYDAEYLVTDGHWHYEIYNMGGKRQMGDIAHLPYSYWFSKPLDRNRRMTNHECPLVMEYGVEYLVCMNWSKLTFISIEGLMKDSLPISYWFDDKDLFHI